jgi:hypothetical protein
VSGVIVFIRYWPVAGNRNPKAGEDDIFYGPEVDKPAFIYKIYRFFF